MSKKYAPFVRISAIGLTAAEAWRNPKTNLRRFRPITRRRQQATSISIRSPRPMTSSSRRPPRDTSHRYVLVASSFRSSMRGFSFIYWISCRFRPSKIESWRAILLNLVSALGLISPSLWDLRGSAKPRLGGVHDPSSCQKRRHLLVGGVLDSLIWRGETSGFKELQLCGSCWGKGLEKGQFTAGLWIILFVFFLVGNLLFFSVAVVL